MGIPWAFTQPNVEIFYLITPNLLKSINTVKVGTSLSDLLAFTVNL
ncbi:hypothetical protein COLO4_08090 [Corchorus olitorius]|uniref:Uncharacterized protein n=1 Tax=Corchorus olitorius TaxID=93759 RepID=A0A1R3KHE5_9ROSI|nr:hypothetical protein COLO4_08090 [Corchorus olitorius]